MLQSLVQQKVAQVENAIKESPRKCVVYISQALKQQLKFCISRIPFVHIQDNLDSPVDYAFGRDKRLPFSNMLHLVKHGIVAKESDVGSLDLTGYDVEKLHSYTCDDNVYVFIKRKGSQTTYRDITFVIQGIDTKITFATVCVLFLYGNIVISTWQVYRNLKDVEDHVQNKNIYNNQNIFYHIQSTLLGLRRVNTQYAIKIRSDEMFANLMPFIKHMVNNPHKITTTNLFIRRVSAFPFHCSDHIIGGKTTDLFKMFLGAELLIHNRIPYNPMVAFAQPYWVPEQILSIGYLLNYYPLYSLQKHNCAFIMTKHFQSVGVHDLMPLQIMYTHWHQSCGKATPTKVIVNETTLSSHQNTIVDLDNYNQLWFAE